MIARQNVEVEDVWRESVEASNPRDFSYRVDKQLTSRQNYSDGRSAARLAACSFNSNCGRIIFFFFFFAEKMKKTAENAHELTTNNQTIS